MKKMCGRDQIKDKKILEAYDKYKSYLSELKVYEECRRGLSGVNIFKLVDTEKMVLMLKTKRN